ncbi:phage head spike fiber domain-containing protein [Paracoccus sp. (in: a-proteobacteria)]|uniref:non-contractile tail sheath protein n=1 Tax=Paracoccus sp. TaxID=267 RepID=UPI002AFFDD91|nr:hypothetical protein [Paracoccus sp. (in: a-proteobacteria)]
MRRNLPEGTYEVRARQRMAAWSIWTDPQLVTVLPPVRRFEPALWHINMPMSISAALTTRGPDGLRLDAVLRRQNDLVGLKWSSRDDLSHPQLGYLESRNYVGTVWDFAFAVSGLPGLDAGAEIEDVPGIVMTVTDDAGQDYFIRLVNYLTSGTAQAGTLHLDFAGGPVFGGYDISDAAQRVSVPWDRIVEFSIGLAPPGYDPDDDAPLAEPLTISLELTDMDVSGTSALLPRRSPGQSLPTLLRMTDGYDDSYSLTPQRIVDGLVHLGYSGPYVIYIGASHLHDLVWDADAGTFQVDPAHPVAQPVRRWFADLFTRLLAAGFTPILSQSYEIYAEFCPPAWQQRDSAGNGARTGWEPPSTLIAPTVPAAMGYLRDVALTICGLLQDAGGDIHYQVGEPWWWDGSYTGGSPCIYDPTTQAAYVAESGNAVPTPHLASIMEPVGIHGPYLDWLSGKLGASTLWLRDAVKTAHPGATSYVLFFTPQVLSPISEVVTRLNLPIESWRYPAFDVCQIEDYDWVVEGDWANVARTLGVATDTLGYPLERIEYFSGFNLLPETAGEVWPNITRAAEDAFGWGIRNVYVWARPQVWRDGWVYPSGRLVARPGLSPDPGLPFVPPVFPAELRAVRSSYGDIRLSFDPREATAGHIYRIDIMDVTGESVRRTLSLTAPALVGGRVVLDYPVAMSEADFGFAPTWLSWRVRVDGGGPVGISGDVPVDNAAIIKRMIVMGINSLIGGYFNDLSDPSNPGGTGAEGKRDLVAAATFRRRYAELAGLDEVEVLPLQAIVGSSPINPMPYQEGFPLDNYWWDAATNSPGPNLLVADAIVRAADMPPACFVESGPGETTGISYAPEAQRPAILDAFEASNIAMLAWMRANWGNPDLEIWFQGATTSWWGDPPPNETNWDGAKLLRDRQTRMALTVPGFRLGSYVPRSNEWGTYVNEMASGQGWIHYTVEGYHAAAREMAEAMALDINRAEAPPAWTLYEAPSNLRLTKRLDGALVMAWDGRAGATAFRIRVRRADTRAILIDEVVAGRSFSFSRAAQIAAYGVESWYGVFDVAEFAGVDAAPGPYSSYVGEVGGDLVMPAALDAQKQMSGDVVFRWTARAGAPGYWYRNYDVGSGEIISQGALATNSYTFSAADQSAHYGYTVGYVRFEVLEYRAAGGVVSQPAIWDANARAPDQALDGTLPSLWADIGHGQYQLGGNPSSAEALFSRSGGTKWVVGAAGTLVEVPANTLAFDYSSGRRRMVLEGAATNLLLQSQAFAANWGLTRCTRTDGVSDPTGGSNASTLVVSDNSGAAYFEQTLVTVSVGDVCSLSMFVKAGTSSGFSLYGWEIPTAGDGNVSHVASFSLTGGVPVLATQTNLQGVGVHPVGGGWFRVWVTLSITKAGRLFFRVHPSNANVVGNTLSIYLPQLEKGAAITSPIPTTTAAVTRVADTCALTAAAVARFGIPGPCAVALRGALSQAGGAALISMGAAPIIRRNAAGSGVLSITPINQGAGFGGLILGADNFGYTLGWDAAGAVASGNGAIPQASGVAPAGSFSAVYLGASTGATAGSVIMLDEMLVWPIKGSNAAIQAQARVWA